MYRYSVDNAVTYTSEDLVLFRESPFASWMERLTLENPEHGILPDQDSQPPSNSMHRQDDLAETLRAEGKQVSLIDWAAEEPQRRSATLEAMRQGMDFIVNGQLALGPLSGSANLLMRTSGYSELGNYLYIPCDTQSKTTIHSAFRLCFLADLLHSLQGQLPPQMLVIRGGSDLVPLNTEDHIYHYEAVKQRFMSTMREFRKHRMPDPVESAHFGRWSDCANEVLRQRALREENADTSPLPQQQEELEQPVQIAAGAAHSPSSHVEHQDVVYYQNPLEARLATSRGLNVSGTLADQARALGPGPEASPEQPSRRAIDSALENLSFIGSSSESSLLSPPLSVVEEHGAVKAHPLDSDGYVTPEIEMSPEAEPFIDRDEIPPVVTPPIALHTDGREFDVDCIDDSDYQLPKGETVSVPAYAVEQAQAEPSLPFSSSLNTSGIDED
jgi:hypothetical protein